MSVRLTGATFESAKAELLALVKANPGIRTKELAGTPKFHGERTLSARQIRRCLEDLPVRARQAGHGKATWLEWSAR